MPFLSKILCQHLLRFPLCACPWSFLVEGEEGSYGKLLCVRQPKNHAAGAWQHFTGTCLTIGQICGQSYKASTRGVNYDTTVVITSKLFIFTTLDP